MANPDTAESAKSDAKRKRTRIDLGSNQAMQALPDLLRSQEGQTGDMGRLVSLSINQIEPDPSQVRSLLKLSAEQVKEARSKALANTEDGSLDYFEALLSYEPPTNEEQPRGPGAWEQLINLSRSIHANQLVQPIVVSEQGKRHIIIAGERRFLASILAGHEQVRAIVKDGRPGKLKLRVLQYTENAERYELLLVEVLQFIREISALHLEETGKPVDRAFFEKHTNLSRSQAYRYLSVAHADHEVYAALLHAVHNGQITSLKEAVDWLSTTVSQGDNSPWRGKVSAKPFKFGRIQSPDAVKRLLELWRNTFPAETLNEADLKLLKELRSAKIETAKDQRLAYRMLEDLWLKAFSEHDNDQETPR